MVLIITVIIILASSSGCLGTLAVINYHKEEARLDCAAQYRKGWESGSNWVFSMTMDEYRLYRQQKNLTPGIR